MLIEHRSACMTVGYWSNVVLWRHMAIQTWVKIDLSNGQSRDGNKPFLNQSWLLINEVLWLLPKGNSVVNVIATALYNDLNVIPLTWLPYLPVAKSIRGLKYSLYGHNPQYIWTESMMTSSNGNIFCVTGPLCGESIGPGEFPAQRPVTRSFDVFFDLRLNKRLSK